MPTNTAAPEGYSSITPYLCVTDANAAIEFYRLVFGATERMRLAMPDGAIVHAEVEIGNNVIMLSGEFPDMQIHSPEHYGGSPISLMLYVDDVDATFATAVAQGATEVSPIENQFWGDRTGKIRDPWGHIWNIATNVETVSPADVEKRAKALFG